MKSFLEDVAHVFPALLWHNQFFLFLQTPCPHPSIPATVVIVFCIDMKSVNKVILLGNVTRDPDVKATSTGQMVCMFGMATNRVWKDQSGTKQTLAEFHNIVCWGSLAEFCGQNVRKGKPVYIEGYLKTRSWEHAETKAKIFKTEVVVENLVLVGSRDGTDVHANETVDQELEPVAA